MRDTSSSSTKDGQRAGRPRRLKAGTGEAKARGKLLSGAPAKAVSGMVQRIYSSTYI
jgi:hypothetical protein